MDNHRITNYLISTGYWTQIECIDIGEELAYYSALDTEGDEVSLKVELDEEDEMIVCECYEGGIWLTVDLP